MMGWRKKAAGDAPAEAVCWFNLFLQNEISTLPPDELAAWAHWSAEPENLEAFRRLKYAWRGLGPAVQHMQRPSDTEIASDNYDGSQPLAKWLAAGAERAAETERKGRAYRRPLRWWALATSLAISVVAVAGYHHVFVHDAEMRQVYTTGPSERRWITLPDGSTIFLSAFTEISTRYTANRRDIYLARGEVWFSAKGNPFRPFTVLAGKEAISATDTQFDVQRDVASKVDRVTVTVDNGVVEIAEPQRPPSHLLQGQQISYDGAGHVSRVRSADPNGMAAWREGRLPAHP